MNSITKGKRRVRAVHYQAALRKRFPDICVWKNMKQRCYNPNNRTYSYYGGRGIKICDAWRDSYLQFFHDMGPRPSLSHSIERVDPNGDYEPSNCRWATRAEQAINRKVPLSNHSGYRGVCRWNQKWVTKIRVDGKCIHVGYYQDLEVAAWMFDQYAIQLRGDIAITNFEYLPVD